MILLYPSPVISFFNSFGFSLSIQIVNDENSEIDWCVIIYWNYINQAFWKKEKELTVKRLDFEQEAGVDFVTSHMLIQTIFIHVN
jgi:hypothetical protein